MMKKIKQIVAIKWPFFFLLCVVFFVTGCKKFVQIGAPTSQLATASVYSGPATATAAQTAIYTKMFQESYNMATSTGMLSDELINYAISTVLYIQYYTNSMTPDQSPGPWKNAYSYIYTANSVIGGVQNKGNIPAPIAAQLIAEAKFVRAWWQFYLTNLYGDVPLVTGTDYNVNGKLARTPQVQVYQQIVIDLTDAYNNLNYNYVDFSDTAITTERVRPTKNAAAAMLARVYLYTEKYDSAEAEASLVINATGLYKLCTNLTGTNSVFLKNSTEAIWQLQTPLPSSYATPDGQYFYLNAAPTNGVVNFNTISDQLRNTFEPGDKRLAQWIGIYPTSGSGTKYYYPYKYKSNNVSTTTSAPTEYVMMLRLAEQYLIRAEARTQQGNTSGALTDLNTIRNRAGLSNYAGATDKASLLAAILHERQVELFTEWGHRWFDLKRSGTIDAVMGGATGVCKAKGGTWSTTGQLMPVPLSEILSDANLIQNSGY